MTIHLLMPEGGRIGPDDAEKAARDALHQVGLVDDQRAQGQQWPFTFLWSERSPRWVTLTDVLFCEHQAELGYALASRLSCFALTLLVEDETYARSGQSALAVAAEASARIVPMVCLADLNMRGALPCSPYTGSSPTRR